MANPSYDRSDQLLISIGIVFALLVVGSVGFMICGTGRGFFESLWLTTNLLTTVGDSHIATLTDAERIWSLLLMLAGIFTVFYVGMNLVAFIVDGELRSMFGRRQLQSKINHLNNHVIICGFGRMGQELAEQLAQRHVPFVVIDNDEDAVTEADKHDYLYLRGDAMSEELLEASRLDHARGLAACLTSDADNVFVTLSARGIAPNLTITARAKDPGTQEKLRRAGADNVICPPVLGAHKVTRMLLHPAVDELMEMVAEGPDLEVVKVPIERIPGAVGKTLRELSLPATTGVMVVSITHGDGGRRFNPPADLTLESDDAMIVIGQDGAVDRMIAQWGEA